jgi:hypothetical protein
MVKVCRSWGARMGSKRRFVWERWVGLRRENGRWRAVVVVERGLRERRRVVVGRMCIVALVVFVVGGCEGRSVGIEVWM